MQYGNGKYEIAEKELARIAGCVYNPDRDDVEILGFDMYGRPVYYCDYAVSAGSSVLRKGIVVDDGEIDGEHSAALSQHDGSQVWVPFSELSVLLDNSPFHSRRFVRDKYGDRLYVGTFVKYEGRGYYTVADFSADKVTVKPLKAERPFRAEETVPASEIILEDYEPPIGLGVLHWVYPGDTVYILEDWKNTCEVLGQAPDDGDGNARVEVVYGEYLDELKWLKLRHLNVVLNESSNHYGRYFYGHDKKRVRLGDLVKVDGRDELYKVYRFTSRYVDLIPCEVDETAPKHRSVRCEQVMLVEDAER